jgi:nicotinamidase/pyrazinamidase
MSAVPTALIVVDVQNDFTDIPEAALPVAGGAELASRIDDLIARDGERYAAVVATRDWHVAPKGHFSDSPDFRETWPPHCVAGTPGADFHPGLDPSRFDAVFSKGRLTAGYSGFEGATDDGESLADWLRARGIGAVHVVGIATDHCVRATALDALRSELATTVLESFTAGVAPHSSEAALAELEGAGATVVRAPG